jgi:hypothetical protein
MDPQQPKLDEKLRAKVLISTVVRQVVFEMLNENRPEILARSRAKLTALGVTVEDGDIDAQLS